MALSKNDEQLLDLLLKEREKSVDTKQHKPFHIQALQFSMVFLSLLLFITVGALGILTLSKPQIASAANTYSETWTATNGEYISGNAPTSYVWSQGIPANGASAMSTSSTYNSIGAVFTVTAWSVSGTIN